MRPIGALFLLVAVALLLRSTALSALAARGIVVDVLAFTTAMWALRYGESWGSTFGFVLGLGADLDAAHWLGRHALLLALLGYAVGRLSRTLVRDSSRTQFVLLVIVTLAHQVWAVAFEFGGLESWPYLITRVVLAGLVTAALGTLLLSLLRRASGQPLFGHAVLESGSSS